MKRESYQTEMFNWCEALKDQIQNEDSLISLKIKSTR